MITALSFLNETVMYEIGDSLVAVFFFLGGGVFSFNLSRREYSAVAPQQRCKPVYYRL